MAFNERVNLEILRRFAAEGIALAAPAPAVQMFGELRPPSARSGNLADVRLPVC